MVTIKELLIDHLEHTFEKEAWQPSMAMAIAGLTANLLVSNGPPTTSTRFSEWLARNAEQLGAEWASELHRHYR